MFVAVPNISVARDQAALGRVVAAVRRAAGPDAALLDVHTDMDHNRSVLTLAGTAPALERLVCRLARAVIDHLDITAHDGVHPRVGALDVLPFIPWNGASMDAAADLGRRVGAFLGSSLGVPVFHYWALASGERRRLVTYRRHAGRLAAALASDLPPDAGPPFPHPTAGATCVGARPVMVAYNVMVRGDAVEARRIAARIRERNGGLAGVESLAFELPARRCHQISCNLRKPDAVGPRRVYEAVCDAAEGTGLEVGVAEVVGLAPDSAIPEPPIAAGLPTRPMTLERAMERAGLQLAATA